MSGGWLGLLCLLTLPTLFEISQSQISGSSLAKNENDFDRNENDFDRNENDFFVLDCSKRYRLTVCSLLTDRLIRWLLSHSLISNFKIV